MEKAIFLDRDGVVNEVRKDQDFIYKKEHVLIISEVKKALKILKENGYKLIVITNQPVIARGIASEEEIKEINNHINSQLDGMIDKFYVCPHRPDMHPDVPIHAMKYRIVCDCRKPSPGMILQATKDFNIDLKNSWMIGDMARDIATGKNANCRTIFIKSAHSDRNPISSTPFDINIKADAYAKNLLDATRFILEK